MCLCCVRVYYDVYFVLIGNSILFFLHTLKTLKMEVEERRLFFAPFSGDVSRANVSEFTYFLLLYYCSVFYSCSASMGLLPGVMVKSWNLSYSF